MQKLLLTWLSVSLLFVSVWADPNGFELKEAKGQYLDITDKGKLVGRYLISRDSALELRHEIVKPYLDLYDAQGADAITEGPPHPGIFIGYEKLRVNGKIYDLWHMKGGNQIHQNFSSMKATSDSASFTSRVDWNDANDATLLAEDRTFTFLTPPAYAYLEVDMISKLTALVGDTQLDGMIKKGGIHFSAGNGMHITQPVYLFPKKPADPNTDIDYPWVGESFNLKGKEYNVVYLNDPFNPRNALFPDYGDSARVGYFFKTTVAKGETLALHVRFLISEGEMPSTELIQKAYNDFAGRSDPVPEVTILKGQRMNPPATAKPAPIAPQPTAPANHTSLP